MMLLLIYDEFMNCVMINVLFWLSCCVFMTFVKMGQKRRSLILMILNGFIELF